MNTRDPAHDRLSSFLGERLGAGELAVFASVPALFAFAGVAPFDLGSSFRGFFFVSFVGLAESLLAGWLLSEDCFGVAEAFWLADVVLGFPSLRGPERVFEVVFCSADCVCFVFSGEVFAGAEDLGVLFCGCCFEAAGFCCLSDSSLLSPPAQVGTYEPAVFFHESLVS